MIDLKGYDFVDFGSGRGGCLKFAKKLGGKLGLGFERSKERVEDLRRSGFNCEVSDITKLELPRKSVKFVTISHVLEHLNNLDEVKYVVNLAKNTAKDFIFIEGPSFDFDDYLKTFGFKFFWFDSCGHRTRLTTTQLKCIFSECNLSKYDILAEIPFINNSISKDIYPLDLQFSYSNPPDITKVKKKIVNFNKGIFRSFIIFVWLKEVNTSLLTCRNKFRLLES